MASRGPTSVLIFAGPLPPPVHGQSVVTELLRAQLADREGLHLVVISTGGEGFGPGRVLAHAQVMLRLVAGRFHRGPRVFYLSLGANIGMVFNAAQGWLARLLGYRIVLHHHTSGHLLETYRAMRWLAAGAGAEAVHLCLCHRLAAQLIERYPTVRRTQVLSNILTLESAPEALPPRGADRPFTLGLISNLTFEKGVREAVAVLRDLRAAGVNAKLLLAGPAGDDEVQAFIDASTADLGEACRHLGPVYGDAKEAFYHALDALVFPTVYKHEAQPMILFEALRLGVPAVAYGRGCVADDLDPTCGLVIDPADSFADRAVPWLKALADDPATLDEARSAARAHYSALQARNGPELQALMDLIAPR